MFWHDPKYAKARETLQARKIGEKLEADLTHQADSDKPGQSVLADPPA